MDPEKTAIIWSDTEEIKYAVVDGDWSRFEGIYIGTAYNNEEEERLEEELTDKVFTDDGLPLLKFVSISDFAAAIRNGAHVIECGSLG